MPGITTKERTRTDYKGRGTGRPLVFSRSWPFTEDASARPYGLSRYAPKSPRATCYVGLFLIALFAAGLAACETQQSPWSPDVDRLYHQMYGPIIDGG